MGESQSSVETVDDDELPPTFKLDLSHLPPVFVLPAHLSINEQHEVEDALSSAGAPLTYDIEEANLVLGNISKARRARSELLWKGIQVEEVGDVKELRSRVYSQNSESSIPVQKRRKLGNRPAGWANEAPDVTVDDSSTGSETDDNVDPGKSLSQLSLSRISTSSTVGSTASVEEKQIIPPPIVRESFTGKVKVVKLEWLNDSFNAAEVLPLELYTIYEAKLLLPTKPVSQTAPAYIAVGQQMSTFSTNKAPESEGETHAGPAKRANVDPKPKTYRHRRSEQYTDAAEKDTVGKSSFSSTWPRSRKRPYQPITRPSHLLHQTTSEHDEATESSLPSMPDWVLQHKVYACERATPLNSPNKDFVCQLKKIKLARILTLDEIGVRAYSTGIASVAAYPHPIQSTREILALPGCDEKMAHLFHEWQSTGQIRTVADLEADPALSVLREMYEIWGVGAKTAREFYYDKGWRDLDDIVEHGWKALSRVQQIGLKYYDEFLLKITRTEVETITAIITHHAKLVTDANVETIIVGGYRRGKAESGDVDLILSHRDEAMTHNVIDRVVKSLERAGWITHTLTLNLTNTRRNQEPLPISTATQAGHGFDTLDKALVVWQDPHWPTKDVDLSANPKAKNPNPHRRVDIIISPWRTVGCAVSGWTSGTTFQRDLRRYAKYIKGWKFDSSGVRERGTGKWVDLEKWTDPTTRCQSWQEAERRVFEGLGLVYREPWDRCTG
jgi:DNA polymerase IV